LKQTTLEREARENIIGLEQWIFTQQLNIECFLSYGRVGSGRRSSRIKLRSQVGLYSTDFIFKFAEMRICSEQILTEDIAIPSRLRDSSTRAASVESTGRPT
jgi:hypothetical protein